MVKSSLCGLFVITLFAMPSVARADDGEAFGGVLKHNVITHAVEIPEDGADIQIGYRGKRLESLSFLGKPSPHVFISVNTKALTDSSKGTNFIAVGLSWKLGNKVFLRPGIGLGVHDQQIPSYTAFPAVGGGSYFVGSNLGSRVVFVPELGLGVQITKKVTVEANWTHLTTARIVSPQAMSMIGARVSFKF